MYIFRFLHQTTTMVSGFTDTFKLYIFRFLHQTTTYKRLGFQPGKLYIFRFLHQTTTLRQSYWPAVVLYIFRFLHQTTTTFFDIKVVRCCISFVFYIKPQPTYYENCCISFVFYIKPQLSFILISVRFVVYLSFSTSNHNLKPFFLFGL